MPRRSAAASIMVGLICVNPATSLAQEESVLDADNFSTPIAKKLAGQIAEPAELRKTMVTFVDTAQAPLMCKITVSSVWEQLQRSKASLDIAKQIKIDAVQRISNDLAGLPANIKAEMEKRSAENNMAAERSSIALMTRELAVKLGLVDDYCGASNKK